MSQDLRIPRVRFRDATPADVPRIAALLNAAAGALAARFGDGPWARLTHEAAVLRGLPHAHVRLGVLGRQVVSTLRLATKKPWAIDVTYFTPATLPLYVTSLAVAVPVQRQGVGRAALRDAEAVARTLGADALRLDAYDAPASASAFYAAAAFTDRGRRSYRGVPLQYWERCVPPSGRAV